MNEEVQHILDTVHIAAIATTNEDGSPFVMSTPMAIDDNAAYWFVPPDTVDAHNITRDNRVSIALFPSRDDVDAGGVFISGRAEKLTGDDVAHAHEVFADRFELDTEDTVILNAAIAYRVTARYIDEINSKDNCWFLYDSTEGIV